MSDGTSESWSGVEPASPAPRRPLDSSRCPSCGASWTAIRGLSSTRSTRRATASRSARRAAASPTAFVPDHDGRSRPLWDEGAPSLALGVPAECSARRRGVAVTLDAARECLDAWRAVCGLPPEPPRPECPIAVVAARRCDSLGLYGRVLGWTVSRALLGPGRDGGGSAAGAAFAALEREFRQLRPGARERCPSASTPSPAKAPPRASQAQREAFPPASPAVAATATGPGPPPPRKHPRRREGGPAGRDAVAGRLRRAPRPSRPLRATRRSPPTSPRSTERSAVPCRVDPSATMGRRISPDVCRRAAADCVEKPVRDGMCHITFGAGLLSRGKR